MYVYTQRICTLCLNNLYNSTYVPTCLLNKDEVGLSKNNNKTMMTTTTLHDQNEDSTRNVETTQGPTKKRQNNNQPIQMKQRQWKKRRNDARTKITTTKRWPQNNDNTLTIYLWLGSKISIGVTFYNITYKTPHLPWTLFSVGSQPGSKISRQYYNPQINLEIAFTLIYYSFNICKYIFLSFSCSFCYYFFVQKSQKSNKLLIFLLIVT